MTQTNLSIKNTHRHREQTSGYQGGGRCAWMEWEFGDSRCKLVYMEWINNKVLPYGTENCIQYPVINYNGKEYFFKCMHLYACITESHCCTAVINTTLETNYTSIKI